MSDKIFNSVLTAAGEQALAQAAISGTPAGFNFMAVGDGGGSVPLIDSASSGLVGEAYRAALNSVTVIDSNKNIIQAELIIPPQIGGFTIREAALYDDSGACLAVANVPETYKPLLAEGAARYQVIRIWLAVSNTASVLLSADPSIIVATADEVKKAQDNAQDYTDSVADTLTESLQTNTAAAFKEAEEYTDGAIFSLNESLSTAIAEAVAAAKRAMWDDDNPVGTVRLFQQNVNPNAKWPWSTWRYIGENKTLRLGKQDGSDLFTGGGADSVILSQGNLPNVQLDVTGTAADTDLGTKQTSTAGKHGHAGKFTPSNTSLDSGDSTRRSWASDYSLNSELLIQENGDHQHDVVIGPHGHAVSGKTSVLGSGNGFDITNSFVKLMGWYRAA